MKFYIFIGLAVNAIPATSAFCCPGFQTGVNPFQPAFCNDGTSATPCCATGSCNIFCCNCDGHCRTGKKRLLASDDDERDPDVDAFALADTAGHGNLTLEQYLEFMGVGEEVYIWIDWFNEHDKNGDGVITKDEVKTDIP